MSQNIAVSYDPIKSLTWNKVVSERVRELSKINSWKAMSHLLLDWTIIMVAIAVSMRENSLLAYIFSVLVIGARQHALLIITHEGAHFRLNNTKWLNDLFSNLFAAFPIFFCTQGYRANHLAHHRHLNSQQDPDWVRKIKLREWQFPQTRKQLIETFATVLMTSWYKMIILFWNLSELGKRDSWTIRDKRHLIFLKLAFYSGLAIGLSLTSTWHIFALYWLVPYFLVMPVAERIRSISEHFGLARENELNHSRNILCSPLEAFVFGPHNVRYHLDHHMFPTVPQYNLPKLHQALSEIPEYSDSAHENHAYIFGTKSVLEDILTAQI